MAVTTAALGHASAMGARAGTRWRETGIPTPNPFGDVAELAAAWRRAYFNAARRV